MPQPFKHPKSGVYYLRRKVPIPRRDALGRTVESKIWVWTGLVCLRSIAPSVQIAVAADGWGMFQIEGR